MFPQVSCTVLLLMQVLCKKQSFFNAFPTHISSLSLRMSEAAAEILRNFYLLLRNRSTSADGTPITARQLESLVRLAEARARVDLRE